MPSKPSEVEEPSASEPSTSSLIDVDTPKVSSVPSDYSSQSVKTDTQATRLEQESEIKDRIASSKNSKSDKEQPRRERAKEEAKGLYDMLKKNSGNPVVIGNAVMVSAFVGVLSWGGFKGFQSANARGGSSWSVGAGAALAGAVGLFGLGDYYVSKWALGKYPVKE